MSISLMGLVVSRMHAGGNGKARHPGHISAALQSDIAHDNDFAISLYSK